MKSNDVQITKLPRLNIYQYIVPQKYRPLLEDYIRYIILLFERLNKETSNKTLNYRKLSKALSKEWGEFFLLGRLQKAFIKENISLSLLTEPIEGFIWIAENRYNLDYVKSTPMLLQIISPLSRLISVLNNATPIFYQPLSNLIFAYFLLYLPHFQKTIKTFKTNKINLNTDLIDKHLENFFSELKYTLSPKTNLIFKLRLCFFVGLYHNLTTKDVKKINFLFYVNSFLYGLYYNLTIKRTNINTNQI